LNKLIILILIRLILGFILLILGLILSKKTLTDREKLSPFECGFSPKTLPRIPLSLRFFLIAIVFLVFDVELVLIFPAIPGSNLGSIFSSVVLLDVFLLILILGLYYELNQGRLN